MKITSKQIQTMWEEHTKNDLRKEFAEVVAIYVGSSTSRLELVESLMKRAGSHRFTNEDERFLYFSRLNHDHLFGEPIPAQFTKVPAGSSFANSHDRKLRSAQQIVEEWLERPWHTGLTNATIAYLERVSAAPDSYWDHAVKFWSEAFPTEEDVTTFLSDKGLHSSHGEAAGYVQSLLRSGDGLAAQPGV